MCVRACVRVNDAINIQPHRASGFQPWLKLVSQPACDNDTSKIVDISGASSYTRHTVLL